ncbi:AsmA protein [Pararhizobium capsulatum DSM 1112]|uniref:AsmA protein n=1 Tax=Pararhizobium capsulatum DSM 1112 TaxID=1121113 RepID=A0ABU0BLV1_9HYPH|nr:AsmA family protein [Pararhizobium capsulatum]MDQ0319212.1 AsmA protein [Pararhizobium capsulatum DSM 1112]
MTEFLRSFAARERWMGVLRSPAFRWTVAGILLFFVLIKVALPLFVSTANIKDNMEAALSRWAGARATIGEAANVSFWPGPTLTLSDVRFETQDGTERLATVKAITADFDLLAALSGRPVFYDFHLVEPVLSVRRDKDGKSNWPTPPWRNSSVVADTRPESPEGEPIGEIVIDNGTVDIEDAVSGRSTRLEYISGTIAWRTPVAKLSASLTAIVNGEPIDLTVSCDAPMTFLAGQESGLRVSLGSGPLHLSFDGKGTAGRYPGIDGDLQITTPSLSGLAHWLGVPGPTATPSSPLSIETTVSGASSGIKMDNLVLALGGDNATGLLDLSLRPDAKPKINGTLAFDGLHTEGLATLFLFPLQTNVEVSAAPRLLDQIDIDLRLSAHSASYGSVTLTNLAAGIMASEGKASLDVGDSGYAGGSLNGRLAAFDGGTKGGEMQVSLRDADLTALAASFGLQGPMLQGQGILSLNLSTEKPLNGVTIRDANGDIRFSGGRGVLSHFDAEAFQSLVAQGRFFDSSATSNGTFPTQSSEIVATLKEGVATLEKAEIRGDQKTLILTGVIPFHTNGLALAGSLTANDGSEPAARFFAGGSWPNAVISPLATLPSQP